MIDNIWKFDFENDGKDNDKVRTLIDNTTDIEKVNKSWKPINFICRYSSP
jgi:hypothetical protein